MTSRLVWRVSGVRREAGFSLVETLVAMVLTLLLATSLFGFVAANVVWSRTQPAAIDIQARARAAVELMTRDLVLAGAGVGAGEQRGTLVAAFAPVVPRRIGVRDADLVDVARADAISMSDVPGRAPAAVLRDSLSGTAPWVVLDTPPPCPLGDPMCGLRAGDPIVVFDGLGHHDFFVVGTPSAGGAPLQYREPGTTFPYAPGAVVAPVESHVYYFDARARQLRHYDGYGSDVPVIDDVVDVRFEYFGDPDSADAAQAADRRGQLSP